MLAAEVLPPRELTTRSSRTFIVSDYPEANPITPPSPVLSISQLSNPPCDGGIIPIFFDSDDDEHKPNTPVRLSDHTFGISRSCTPTDSSSITSVDTIASFIDTRPASAADSAVGPRDGRVDFFELRTFSTPRASPPEPDLVSRFSVSTIDQLSDAPLADNDDTSLSLYDIETPPSAVDATAPSRSFQPPSLPLSPSSENTGNDCTPLSAPSSPGNAIVMSDGRSIFSPTAYSGCSDDVPSVDDHSEFRSSITSDRAPLLKYSKDDAREYPSLQTVIHGSSLGASLEGSRSPISPHVSFGIAGNGQPSAFRGPSLNPTASSPLPVPPLLSGVHDPDVAAAVAKRASSRLGTSYQDQPSSKLARASYRRLGSSGGSNQESVIRPTSGANESNAISSGPGLDLAREPSGSTDSDVSGASDLEPSLRHLKDVLVELYIDQERFREINPQFIFNSYRREDQLSKTLTPNVSHGAGTSLHASLNSVYSTMFPGGVAEYRLVEVQSWCFHYAALDSAPTLRRMSLNGDNKHDYMSRESSLTVKNNGMYAVKGSEGKGRAPWEFRYLIEDRLTSSGEKMNGEKMFTPLCFMCSPALFTLERAKRIGLLHIVKKSISPKISASKVDMSSHTSLPIPLTPKSTNKKTSHASTLDRTILPLLVQTTVVTSSAPASGAIASATVWETGAGSPAFTVDLASSKSATPPHHHERKASGSSGKGFPLFGRRHTSSNLWEAGKSKLPRRPKTSSDQMRASGASPPPTVEPQRPRPATADARTAAHVPRPDAERPRRQQLRLSIPKSNPQPVPAANNAVSPINTHSSPVNILSSPVRVGGPIASKEQIRGWLSETSSPPLSPSQAPPLSPLSIHSGASINSSFPSPLSSPPAHRGTIPRSLIPVVAERPSLPSPPRLRPYTAGGRKRPSTANEARRMPTLWSSPRIPPPGSSSGFVSLSSSVSRL